MRFTDPLEQFLDGNGDPLSNGTLDFYQTGTSTPLDTFSDSTLTTANSNPITLNSAGRLPNDVFLKAEDYKVVLKDSGGSTIWTADPVEGAGASDVSLETKTGAFTVDATDNNKTFLLDASSSGFTVSLPAVADVAANFSVTFIRTDSSGNTTTLDGSGSETINGATTYDQSAQYATVEIANTGSEWVITQQSVTFATQSQAEAGTDNTVSMTPLRTDQAIKDQFASTELTIASGKITPTDTAHTVDTESDAASDDLSIIGTDNLGDEELLYLRAEDASRTVVLKHNTGSPGANEAKIFLADDSDFSLDDTDKSILLQRRGSEIHELTRSPVGGSLSLGTPVSASGSSIDFTVPNNAKVIQVVLSNISTDGSSGVYVRLGDSGGIETSGYTSYTQVANSSGSVNSTTGFAIYHGAAGNILDGIMTIALVDESSNHFVESQSIGDQTNGNAQTGGGQKSISGAITTVQALAVSSDSFDGGTVNVNYWT